MSGMFSEESVLPQRLSIVCPRPLDFWYNTGTPGKGAWVLSEAVAPDRKVVG